MIIRHNLPGLIAEKGYSKNVNKLSTHLERISTGLRINKAADDAAGLAIAEKLRSQINGFQQALRNAQDGISLIQTADGALQESHAILQKMRELSVQAANDTLTSNDRAAIQKEIDQLKSGLNEIADHTEFNNRKLLDGSASLTVTTSSDAVYLASGVLPVSGFSDNSLSFRSSGDLRIDSVISGGQNQIQGSHVYTQINGTRSELTLSPEDHTPYSGLERLETKGLDEGVYQIESRESPFGGVRYVGADGQSASNPLPTLGVSGMDITPSPNLVPVGEYTVTPASELPFMAIFQDSEITRHDLIRGVQPSGRPDIDVTMDIAVMQTSVSAETETAWTDIGGSGGGSVIEGHPAGPHFTANITYQTEIDFDTNLYTHFKVTDTEPRELLASDILATSSYVSAADSEIEMELTFKSEATARVDMELGFRSEPADQVQMALSYRSEPAARMAMTLDFRAEAADQLDLSLSYRSAADAEIDMTLDYRSETGDQIGLDLSYQTMVGSKISTTATYYSKAAETVSFQTTYTLPAGYSVTIEEAGAPPTVLGTANIGGLDLLEAQAQLSADFVGQDITFGIDTAGETRRLTVTNNRAASVTITDSAANELGISAALGTDPSDNHVEGTYRDHQLTTVIALGNRTIEEIAAVLDTGLGLKGLDFTAFDNGDGTRRIAIENSGSYRVSIVDDLSTDSVEGELGLNGYASLPGGGVWNSATNLFHQHTFETTIGGLFLEGAGQLNETIQNQINSQNVNGAQLSGINVSTTGGSLERLAVSNGSIYRLSFSETVGDAWTELNMPTGLQERGGLGNSNQVYHHHTVTIDVGDRDLEGIQTQLQTGLNVALAADGLSNPSSDTFSLENGSLGGLDRILALNTGTSATGYRMTLTDQSGHTAAQLALNTEIPRATDYPAANQVYRQYTVTVPLGDRNLEQLRASLQTSLETALASDDIADAASDMFLRNVVSPGLERIQVRNSGTADTGYRVNLSDHGSSQLASQLHLDATIDREQTANALAVYHEAAQTVNIGGQDLPGIAAQVQTTLDTLLNGDGIAEPHPSIALETGVAGKDRILIHNSGINLSSYDIGISDHAGVSANLLGIDTAVHSGEDLLTANQVYRNETVTVEVGDRNLEEIRSQLQSELETLLSNDDIAPNPNTGNTFLRNSLSAGLERIQISNAGIGNTHYAISIADDTGTVASQLGMVATVVPSNSQNANSVYHDAVRAVNIGNRSLSQISSRLQSALQGFLGLDGIANTNTSDVFSLETGAPGLDRLQINNSGTSDTSYDIGIIDATGDTAALLGIDTNVERGTAALGTNEVYQGHILTLDVGNQSLEEIRQTLQAGLDGLLVLDGIAPNTNTGQTFQMETLSPGLNRLRIQNSGLGNTSYAISISDETGNLAQQLNLNQAVFPAVDGVSNAVYHEYRQNIAVGSLDLEELRGHLQQTLHTVLSADELTDSNTSDTFLREPVTAGRDRLSIDNAGNGNTSYEISLSDVTGLVAQQLGIDTVVTRESSHQGTDRDYGYPWGTVVPAGANIENAFSEIDAHLLFSTDWIDQPDYQGQNLGKFTIRNVGGDPEMRRVTLHGDGATQLLGGETVLRASEESQSREWVARDRVKIETHYEGVKNSGEEVAGTRIDWWWEGVDGSLNPLVGDPNLGFSSLTMPDNDETHAEWSVGDTWTLFTVARGDENHAQLDFNLVDSLSGSDYGFGGGGTRGGGRYRFNAGVLEDQSMAILQSVRADAGSQESVRHRIEFGNDLYTAKNAVVYKERYASGSFDHYAHATFGNDTSYYFANGGEPESYIREVSVWKQESTNLSLLFTVKNDHTLLVEGKGYERDGSVADFGPIEMPIPSGEAVTVGPIRFDALHIGGRLTSGDKFVINVAARAGNENAAATHGDLTESDQAVKITGTPFQVSQSRTEYRFDAGALNGKELNLLGYFVHPVIGGSDTGVYTGTLNLQTGAAGFVGGLKVDGPQAVHLDVNYSGRFDHYAGALVNDYAFARLKPNEAVQSIIAAIEYEPLSSYNGSVIFEALRVDEDGVVLRAQAHLYDVNGGYQYGEEGYLRVGKENANLTLFQKPGFEGITFDRFNFENLDRLVSGDRFTVTLSANAEIPGENFDELFLFSEDYPGTVYPMGWRFRDGTIDNRTTTVKLFQIGSGTTATGAASRGSIREGEMTLVFKDFHGGTTEGIEGNENTPRVIENTVQFLSQLQTGVDMGTANRHSRLMDIAEFYGSNGAFLLEKPQLLTFTYEGQSRTVLLNAQETFQDVLDRINRIFYEDFGQDRRIPQEQSGSFASFADQDSLFGGFAGPKGSFTIQSAVAGKEGEITVFGDTDLLKALGLQTLRGSQERAVQLTVRDALTGSLIQNGLKGLTGQAIALGNDPNLPLMFSSQFGESKAEYDSNLKSFLYSQEEAQPIFVHLSDRAQTLHVGSDANQSVQFRIGGMDAKHLNVSGLNVLSNETAQKGIGSVDRAIRYVSSYRSALGALQNRLEKTIAVLGTNAENLTRSESQIRDADIAKETISFAKQQLLVQTAHSMVAQANQLPKTVLDLLNP